MSLEKFQILLVKQHLSVWEARLDSFLEKIYNVNFHRRRHKYELDLAVLKHIKDFVEQNLFGLLNVEVNVFEDKQQGYLLVLTEVVLDLSDHLHRVEVLLLLLLQADYFAELHQDLLLVSVTESRVHSHYFESLLLFLLLHRAIVYDWG